MRRISLILAPVVLLGGLFTYYSIKTITYQETDEYLTYEMQRVSRHFKVLREIPPFHTLGEFEITEFYFEPEFKDTLIYESGEDDYVPYRELHFSLEGDGIIYAVALRHLVLGKDDIARGTLLILIGLIVLVSGTLLIFLNQATSRIWNPFFLTLGKLGEYNVQKHPPKFPSSNIDEFNILNDTLTQMLMKMNDDYMRTKAFNENAAHELQTHLSVIKASNEELINALPSESEWIQSARKSYIAATKLAHIQRSLLLMSKIGNKEFDKSTSVSFDRIVTQVLEEFDEFIQLRNLSVSVNTEPTQILMDEGLALILCSNLVKNAVKHNYEGGKIEIQLKKKIFQITNTGTKLESPPEYMLERFIKGSGDGAGLGLAIVKQICDSYNFRISYQVKSELHTIKIFFT